MVLSPFQGSAEAPVMVNAKSPSPPSLTNDSPTSLPITIFPPTALVGPPSFEPLAPVIIIVLDRMV